MAWGRDIPARTERYNRSAVRVGFAGIVLCIWAALIELPHLWLLKPPLIAASMLAFALILEHGVREWSPMWERWIRERIEREKWQRLGHEGLANDWLQKADPHMPGRVQSSARKE